MLLKKFGIIGSRITISRTSSMSGRKIPMTRASSTTDVVMTLNRNAGMKLEIISDEDEFLWNQCKIGKNRLCNKLCFVTHSVMKITLLYYKPGFNKLSYIPDMI